eukprot:SAG31_NODE_1042_length_10187_cov_54.452121_13_plen_68_part_00
MRQQKILIKSVRDVQTGRCQRFESLLAQQQQKFADVLLAQRERMMKDKRLVAFSAQQPPASSHATGR